LQNPPWHGRPAHETRARCPCHLGWRGFCKSLGYIARGNVTRDNATLHIQTTQVRSGPDGTSLPWPLHHAGLVVEGNLAVDSAIGVSVERGARAVVRGNRARRVKKPLVRPPPAASGTA
jgi:hypothetical protein